MLGLAIAACLWFGWSTNAWSQSAEGLKAANGTISAEPTKICRSPKELLGWQRHGRSSEVGFEFKAYLILALRNWSQVRVEYEGRSIALIATGEMTNELCQIRAGTLISFEGRAYRDKEGEVRYVLEHFANRWPGEYLKPVPAKLAPGTKGTPLNRHAFAIGEIREILNVGNRTHLIAHDQNYRFEVVHYGSNEKLRPMHVDQRWRFVGTVRRNRNRNPTSPLHQIVLMDEAQMHHSRRNSNADDGADEGPSSESVSAGGDSAAEIVQQFEGVVAFSDGERNLGIVDGDRRFWVRTDLAHQLSPGNKIRGVGTSAWNHPLDMDCYQARFTEVIGPVMSDLPEPVRLDGIADLAAMPRLPTRVKLNAKVSYCAFHDTTMDLYLKTSEGKLIARIPISETSPTETLGILAEGTEIDFSGIPVRHSFDKAHPMLPGSGMLWVYVASADDVRILNRPFTMPTNHLIASVGLVVIGLLCGGFWIDRLRRRVRADARSLTEFDHHFQTAFGAMQCGVLIVDEQSQILRSNHRLSSFFGVEPTVNSPLRFYLPRMDASFESPTSMSSLIDESNQSPNCALSAELLMHDLKRTIRVFTCPIEVDQRRGPTRLWLFEDISEKRQLESELLQSQKMDAVGRLSGGVAHDFNNLLLVIQSSLGMIRDDFSLATDDNEHDGLKAAELAVKRASALTQQLLGFARRQRLEKKRVNAVSLVEDVGVLASRMITAPQTFRVNKQCDCVMVDIDSGRIEQALFNLCINAIDATKADGGHVSLTISSVNDPTFGPSAQFSIVDNGSGVAKSDRQNIFDPFFTTKPSGEGTGLGLSVALGIVEQHGGRIDFGSKPEQGTRFDIVLPAVIDSPRRIEQSLDNADGAERSDPTSARLSLSVLVVEDDPDVCAASCKMLKRLGHRFESVENAMMAIQRLAYETPDLVMLDLILPEMSGLEAYHEIRSAWPNLPILFCSGHADAAIMIRDECYPETPPLLPKPFKVEQLEASLDALVRSGKTAGESGSGVVGEATSLH